MRKMQKIIVQKQITAQRKQGTFWKGEGVEEGFAEKRTSQDFWIQVTENSSNWFKQSGIN